MAAETGKIPNIQLRDVFNLKTDVDHEVVFQNIGMSITTEMVTFAVITDQKTRSKFQKQADKEIQHCKNVICNRTPFQVFYSKADVEYSNQHKHTQADSRSVGEESNQLDYDIVAISGLMIPAAVFALLILWMLY